MNILAFWPIIKWVLQVLGFMGPEDKEAERNYKMKLLEAQARKDEGLVKAFADFQSGQGQLFKVLQAVLVAALYYDTFWGYKRAVSTAVELYAAGIPGMLVMSILLFPFYGPALVAGVSKAFDVMIELSAKRMSGGVGGGTVTPTTSAGPKPGTGASKAEAPPFTSGSGFKRTDPDLGVPEEPTSSEAR